MSLWGEDSAKPATVARRRGRPPKVQDHPYALTPDEIAGTAAISADRATVGELVLPLPTVAGQPLPSPELVRDTFEQPSVAVRVGSWRVPALTAAADPAFAWLQTLDLKVGAYGGSVHHLTDMAGFAADLVSRGRLLPILEPETMSAWWRPVLTGADAAWVRMLAQTAPPSLFALRAESDPDDWADLLDALTDAAARTVLGGTRLTTGRAGTPAVRAWLKALTGPDRRVHGLDPARAVALADALTDWQADAFAGPVRACFRLREPVEGSDDWRLALGLQDGDDPSSVADADVVWGSHGTLPGLGRHLDAPQQTFLTELGKAARLYPALDDALRTARPRELRLDTGGAHQFLSHAAPLLATSGFGVQLPGWWTKPDARLGLKLTASTPPQPGRVDSAA
ncbi:MAG: SNF2 helicase-associated domain-containing protein, partial [Microlunatus sp.]|nr:SNF2 helicase-associated domain-containing protein [Microlunatus sp.]